MNTNIGRPPANGYLKLVEGLHQMADEPSNPYLSNFSLDFLKQLEWSPEVVYRVDEAFACREDIDRARDRMSVNASYAGNLALRAVHAELFDQAGYPETHRSPDSWSQDIERSVTEGRFYYDIWLFDVMSNIVQRYAPLQVCASRLSERQQHPLTVIDIGSSQGHGGKMLLSEEHSFAPPKSMAEGLGDFNQRLAQDVSYDKVVGVDYVDVMRDDLARQWAKACSIPPHEMTPERIEQYDALDKLVVPKAKFVQGEIGREKFMDYVSEYTAGGDIVFMSTVMYQMSERKRRLAWRQAQELLAPGGVIIVQDFARVRPGGKARLKYVDNWYNPATKPYRTILYDSLNPGQGLTEIFHWTSGRCQEGTVPDQKAVEALENLRLKP